MLGGFFVYYVHILYENIGFPNVNSTVRYFLGVSFGPFTKVHVGISVMYFDLEARRHNFLAVEGTSACPTEPSKDVNVKTAGVPWGREWVQFRAKKVQLTTSLLGPTKDILGALMEQHIISLDFSFGELETEHPQKKICLFNDHDS